MSITILKSGMMSSVQDLGRWGFQQYGVPIGGAMDKLSASLANIICGNDENEALIEMTLHGTSILFNEDVYFSVTGGGCRVFAEEVELPFNRLIHIPAFSIIHTRADAAGCRSYLAVAGGLDINKEMGSASTYVPSGIGGVEGRNLATGDILPIKNTDLQVHPPSLKMLSTNISVSHWQVPDLVMQNDDPAIIHVVRGPEYEFFDDRSRDRFMHGLFSISNRSNRMGYRLEGQKIELNEKVELVSTPVTSGVIQITNEGDPIILMADAQTTGGYPRIVWVCSADLPRLSQLRPGTKIRFKEIDEVESETRYEKILAVLTKIRSAIAI